MILPQMDRNNRAQCPEGYCWAYLNDTGEIVYIDPDVIDSGTYNGSAIVWLGIDSNEFTHDLDGDVLDPDQLSDLYIKFPFFQVDVATDNKELRERYYVMLSLLRRPE